MEATVGCFLEAFPVVFDRELLRHGFDVNTVRPGKWYYLYLVLKEGKGGWHER